MAKKVLGNDPFTGATPPTTPPAKAASAPPKRATKPAPAKPTAKRATKPAPAKPDVAPEVTVGPEETNAPAAPEPAAPAASEQSATHEPALPASPDTSLPPATTSDLPAQVSQLIAEAQRDPDARATLDALAAQLRTMSEAPSEAREPEAPRSSAYDVSREMLTSDYYLRQWGPVAMRDRSEEVDDFGLDPKVEERWRPMADFLFDRYWRVEVTGIEHVPASGRVILVANHGGAIPFDGWMLATALRREHPAQRQLRWLAEDFIFHFPFAGTTLNRLGAVRACQENAERLLRKDHVVGLFPEGVKGIAKPYRERYQLQRFGRGGHIKLALRTQSPIVPVTIVGSEETHPMLAPSGYLAKMLGLPYFPITPTFPWLGPAGLLPLPSKWRIEFGEPLAMEGYGPRQADDELLVGRLNEKLRATVQDNLDRAVRARRSVFRG